MEQKNENPVDNAELEIDGDIINEVVLEFTENSALLEGMCSCVCINDEQCCGCLIQ
jgi:hypothetical protein